MYPSPIKWRTDNVARKVVIITILVIVMAGLDGD